MRTRLIGWTTLVVALTAIAYASHFETQPTKDVAYRWATSISALLFYVLLLGFVLLLTRGLDRASFLALRRPSSWRRAARIAVLVVVATMVVSAAVSPLGNPEKEQGLIPEHWNSHRIAQFAAFAAVVTIIGPLTEELLFRGVGFGLLEPFGQTTAVVAVGLSFGLIHGLVAGFPVIAALGIGLAYLRARTGSLYPCVLLHAAFNAVGLAIGIST